MYYDGIFFLLLSTHVLSAVGAVYVFLKSNE